MISQLSTMQAIAYLAYAATSTHQPALVSSSCDFGETYQFRRASCVVELTNNGTSPIRISGIKALDPKDSVDKDQVVIDGHAQAYLTVSVNPSNSLGYTKRYFELHTNESSDGVRYAEAKGVVLSVLDDASPALDFGVVDLVADTTPSKDVALASREISNFKIERVISKPDYLDVTIAPDGRTLHATLLKSAPWGIHKTDTVKVAINTPAQPEVSIAVKMDVHGDVIPDSNPYALGLMRKGNRNDVLIPLRSRTSKDFKVGAVQVSRANAKATVVQCAPVSKGCRMLKIIISDKQAHAQIGGLITVEFPDYGQVLSLYVWGMLVDKTTKVLDFEDEMKKQEAATAAAPGEKSMAETSISASGVDISKAIKSEVSKASVPPPSGTGPLLTWSVANQSLIYGFVVYRSEAVDGPAVKANKGTILVTGSPTDTSTYQWRDSTAVPGKKYWYSIDVIRKTGIKQQLSGPQGVMAK